MSKQYRSEHLFEWMVDVRRALHRQPELAFEEVETAKRLMAELDTLKSSVDLSATHLMRRLSPCVPIWMRYPARKIPICHLLPPSKGRCMPVATMHI